MQIRTLNTLTVHLRTLTHQSPQLVFLRSIDHAQSITRNSAPPINTTNHHHHYNTQNHQQNMQSIQIKNVITWYLLPNVTDIIV
jgi:hypothetical protein